MELVKFYFVLYFAANKVSRDQPLLLRVEDNVAHDLRGAEARADGLEEVGVEGEEGAARAEAGVLAGVEREEDAAVLRGREGGEVGVVVQREVLDEECGDEARSEGVDAEGYVAGEGVVNLLLHDVDEVLYARTGCRWVRRSQRSSLRSATRPACTSLQMVAARATWV